MYVGMTSTDHEMINKYIQEENLGFANPMFTSNEVFKLIKVEGEDEAYKIKGLNGGMLVLSLRHSSYLGCSENEIVDARSTTNFVFN